MHVCTGLLKNTKFLLSAIGKTYQSHVNKIKANLDSRNLFKQSLKTIYIKHNQM